jgi:hypothetical protein
VLLGPGFAIGHATSVSLSGASLGPVPALPVLAALPSAGPFPLVALLVLLIPVGTGVLVGIRITRDLGEIREMLLRAAYVGASTGIVFAVLAALVGGPGGPGQLAVTGPSPWQLGLAACVEIGGGALAVAALRAWRLRAARQQPATAAG